MGGLLKFADGRSHDRLAPNLFADILRLIGKLAPSDDKPSRNQCFRNLPDDAMAAANFIGSLT